MPYIRTYFIEFLAFGLKQARACAFAGSFFVLLAASHQIPLFGMHRYDFLFIASVVIQYILYAARIETKDEVRTIALFHLIGLILELYKTHPSVGSWSYPEQGYLKIGAVPLYSGFMYAAVGSYIAQAWRLFALKLEGYTQEIHRTSIALGAIAYANFFTNHYGYDIRWLIIGAFFLLYRNVRVRFTPIDRARSMPLAIGFALIAFFIWIAENISTYFGAWQYPHQADGWSAVSLHKITSWFLLVIVSFIIVAGLKHMKGGRNLRVPTKKIDNISN